MILINIWLLSQKNNNQKTSSNVLGESFHYASLNQEPNHSLIKRLVVRQKIKASLSVQLNFNVNLWCLKAWETETGTSRAKMRACHHSLCAFSFCAVIFISDRPQVLWDPEPMSSTVEEIAYCTDWTLMMALRAQSKKKGNTWNVKTAGVLPLEKVKRDAT